LVTVDLLLTVSQRLHQLPEFSDFDLKELYEFSKLLLNDWAEKIEAGRLSVSLQAIVENTFLVFIPQPEIPSDRHDSIGKLREIGDQLIHASGQIQSFLSTERLSQPDEIRLLQELETAIGDKEKIGWFDGAKEITARKNSTEAADNLKRALAWYLDLVNPPGNSATRQFLTEAINGAQQDIPLAFASLFKDRYRQWFETARKW